MGKLTPEPTVHLLGDTRDSLLVRGSSYERRVRFREQRVRMDFRINSRTSHESAAASATAAASPCLQGRRTCTISVHLTSPPKSSINLSFIWQLMPTSHISFLSGGTNQALEVAVFSPSAGDEWRRPFEMTSFVPDFRLPTASALLGHLVSVHRRLRVTPLCSRLRSRCDD